MNEKRFEELKEIIKKIDMDDTDAPLPSAMNKVGEKECHCGRKFAMPFYLIQHIKDVHCE